MKAYGGIINKTEFVKELKNHQKADLFVKGTYWENGKGCAVGCSLHSISVAKKIEVFDFSDHSRYEDLLGVPEWLARVEDRLFEGVSLERSKTWPVEFAQAIKPGVDLDKIKVPFLKIVVSSTLNSAADALESSGIKDHAKVLRREAKAIQKAKVPNWEKARKLARDTAAAAYAAAAAAYAAAAAAAAADAADAAAAADDAAAADAAYAAADAAYAAAADTRAKKYEELADELLKLMKQLK